MADIGNGIVAAAAVFDYCVPVKIAGFTQEFKQAWACAFFRILARELVLLDRIVTQVEEQFHAVFDKGVFRALADEAALVGHAEDPMWATAHFEQHTSGSVRIIAAKKRREGSALAPDVDFAAD